MDDRRTSGKTGLRRNLTGFICTGMVVFALFSQMYVSLPVRATSVTSQTIQDKEDQIAQIRQEREALQNGLTDLQTLRAQLDAQRADLKNYIVQLDGTLSEIEEKIAVLKTQINEKLEQITQTEADLAAAREVEENQKELIVRHIRLMYESSDIQIMDLLMTATSMRELLNRAEAMERIIAYDQTMWEEYQETSQYIALCVEQLELEREVLEDTEAAVEEEQHNLELLIDQKTQDIRNYETDINNKDQAIKEYQASIAEREDEIKALEAAIAEERRQLLANNGNLLTYDGGVFKFPMASYNRISDDYGMRMHPTLGVEQFHYGVDFTAPKGTAIYAAYDGKVVAATYSGSMGNYVMIDHGDSLYTLYMHASALYVSKGDLVVRGDTIAAVGSTGRASGNHLHFAVRLNGEYVSPWNYLSE
ncbi:MAG: peptidoglycan DD-metalloendopeptidase family protein [Candidatus Gastranaerophilales bacterium]|nr:peptidoglycan DD-metalloendopeptidase family protein [Candidatus Gastranaerophilales bacterium]